MCFGGPPCINRSCTVGLGVARSRLTQRPMDQFIVVPSCSCFGCSARAAFPVRHAQDEMSSRRKRRCRTNMLLMEATARQRRPKCTKHASRGRDYLTVQARLRALSCPWRRQLDRAGPAAQHAITPIPDYTKLVVGPQTLEFLSGDRGRFSARPPAKIRNSCRLDFGRPNFLDTEWGPPHAGPQNGILSISVGKERAVF